MMKINLKKKLKKAAMALFAFAIMAGAFNQAHAIEIASGDLVLVLYGNSTEYYQNLGSGSTLLTPGSAFDFTLSNSTLTTVGGANPTKWALVSFSFDADSGSATDLNASLAPILPSQTGAVNIPLAWNAAAAWSGQLSGDGSTQQFLPASDSSSYSQNLDAAGNGSMAGAFPVSTTGTFGATLDIIEGNYNTNAIIDVGNASLSVRAGDGSAIFTVAGVTAVAPVPLPASVVLFGSALVGLAGVARRKLIAA